MRDWNVKLDQLPCLTLAADARLTQLNYTDDQIWDLILQSGEPSALSFETTYGLRARNMRLFPRFSEKDEHITNPASFYTPPIIHHFAPNYALLSCSPFAGIDVILEYIVLACNQVAGRLRVINTGVTPRKISLAWIAILVPGEKGDRMAPDKLEGINVLTGSFDNLHTVMFLSGGPEANHSPHPNLSLTVELLPGLERQLLWSQTTHAKREIAFETSRQVGSFKWDAHIARIERINGAQLEIETGDTARDLTFSLGQSTALRLLQGPTEHLPHPAPLQTRRSDQGYSLRQDGSDFNHLWSGQSTLDTWYLAQQIVYAAPDLAKGLLLNLIHTQDESGQIDLKPGLNGRVSSLLGTPILADLAWRIYEQTEDQAFLEQVFPALLNFNNAWFKPEEDRDQDGIPEWRHPIQTGYEDNPMFMTWQAWSSGVPITFVESPALCAFLSHDCNSLLQIASSIGMTVPITALKKRIKTLENMIQTCWSEDKNTFQYVDRDLHISNHGQMLGQIRGSGTISSSHPTLPHPTRLVVRVMYGGNTRPPLRIEIFGTAPDGNPQQETIESYQIRWSLKLGSWVTEQRFSAFHSMEVQNTQTQDLTQVFSPDHEFHDQTLFAPLWSKSATEAQANALIQNHMINPAGYWGAYGLLAAPNYPGAEAARYCESTWLIWDQIIGEGLLAYNQQTLTAELVGGLLNAIQANLQKNGAFRQHYNARTGEGIGERNALTGLPPLSLFLNTLGVQIISPWKVKVWGNNPFPWDVVLRYRGLIVRCAKNQTTIAFPDGRTIQVPGSEPCTVMGRSS